MNGSRLISVIAILLAICPSRISPGQQQVGGTPTPFGPITVAPRIIVSPDGTEMDVYVDVEGTNYDSSLSVYFNTAEGDVYNDVTPTYSFSDIGGAGGAFAMGTLSRNAGATYSLYGYGGVCSVHSGEGGGGGPDPCPDGYLEDGSCYEPPIDRPLIVGLSPAQQQCNSYETGATYTKYGPVVITLQPAAPQVISLSTYSVNQGDQDILTVTGTNLIEGSGDQLRANLSGGGSPFTLIGTPSATSATFSYDFTGYPEGDWLFTVSNNEGTSSGNDFKVHPPQTWPSTLPPDPCALTSNPQLGFTSIVPTGMTGGGGTMTLSFSGNAFAALSPSVTYGPFSTPSSIAANIAALITKNYFQYGLSAKAFGPIVIYGGTATLGAVSSVISGNAGASPPFTTDTSTQAAATAQAVCTAAPKKPAPPTEVTIVGFIDKDAIILPMGEGPGMDLAFPASGVGGLADLVHYPPCSDELLALALGNPLYAVSQADDAYASAWLLKFSGNDVLPLNIIPSDLKSQPRKFRLFNDFSFNQSTSNTAVGDTLDPCGTGLAFQGDQYKDDGHIGTSRLGYQYQLSEVRVDKAGQKGFLALNGHEVPWVWSVIEFDQLGYPKGIQNFSPTEPTTNYQIFPTYYIYVNKKLTYRTKQGTPTAFSLLPPGIQLSLTDIY